MFNYQSFLPLILAILIIGCSSPTPAVTYSDSSGSQAQSGKNAGQQLPITGRAVVPNGTKLDLEVARTEQEQEMGLMYRPALPNNRGMLFQFRSAQPISFWMKNTYVPLDIVFMRKGVVQYIASAVPPCTNDPCPTYGPKLPVDQVIELRSGLASELGLKIGDPIKIEFLK
ncbi:DUF192 domain-containing protein [Aetokthonos hydrillicola Thurmond2011]|jgi:hypothetical protein|uniref:DUF192 domain-containing protein n=1 Tax=Aetokthonos hydrillicola Thurmond2011 TaxID=2712845 RepID=A0AAP5MDB0_9CYAN|nr:DUF192 domain-containing protein [Aetokthonos hydrillicola]MBO3462805.1 DUF192 domain-containing protein [Aetokthonos hydrillicola CCALA 1050]MBW4591003.1 DUF192 domain-containing protein [Aetokthonos hydrillicola CCALA 1050]MDR9900317.1 DUF192 domain-containing protein [Aetokthonos hydrillicola Thurmond2011]